MILEVKSCSKVLLALCWGYGKSPCFSGMRVLRLFSVDEAVSNLHVVVGRVFLECAFCYGRDY